MDRWFFFAYPFFALPKPLCLGCLKLNANTSELGGKGQPEPEDVAVVTRAAVEAEG